MKRSLSTFRLLGAAFAMLCVFGAFSPSFAQSSRARASCSSLGEVEFEQMADELFNRIFTDPAFRAVSSGNARPVIVIGDLVNDSHSYRLETDVMFNALRNAIVRSQAVRLQAQGADFPDYALSAQLTSSFERGNGGSNAGGFTLNITLTRPNGEFVGAWNVRRGC